MAVPAAVNQRNAPLRLISSVLQLQWQAALVPLGFTQYWLSAVATLLLRGFVFLGAPPQEYRNNGKVRNFTHSTWFFATKGIHLTPKAYPQLREAMHTVDHMAQREDVFRKRIRVRARG